MGDRRRKGGKWDLYKGGKQERYLKREAFVFYYCLSSSQKHKPSIFLLQFNILRGFKQNFIFEKM